MVDFPLPIKVEAAFGALLTADPSTWVWTDLTSRAFVDASPSPIGITRGRQDEQSEAQTSQMTVRLDNPDGHLTPGNPLSPHYPNAKTGTPLRARLDVAAGAPSGLQVPGHDNSCAVTPDTAVLDITGDIDIRIDVHPRSWRPGREQHLAGKYEYVTSSDRSWVLSLGVDGGLQFWWTTDGTTATRIEISSTAAVAADAGRQVVRVTLDVNNGAAGNTVVFYTGDSLSGPWTQLGAAVVTAGTTSIHGGVAEVSVGGIRPSFNGNPDYDNLNGQVFGFQLRNGIGGTLVADPAFGALDAGTRSFVDTAGRAWEITGGAAITDPRIRYIGQIAEIAPTWPYGDVETGHQDGESRVDITASGIMRRLGQGASPLRSAFYRGILGDNVTTPRAYWSCEDAAESTTLASALGGPPMTIIGAVTPAEFDGLNASAPLPVFGVGRLIGSVPAYTPATVHMRVIATVGFPDSLAADSPILECVTTGTARRWQVVLRTGGNPLVRAYDADDTQIFSQAISFGGWFGRRGMVWLLLTQNGANIDWNLGFAEQDAGLPNAFSQQLAGHTFDRVTTVIAGGAADLNGTAIGHLAVLDSDEFWDIVAFVSAWRGETALDRMSRLADEEGVPLLIRQDGDSPALGPQTQQTFLGLLREGAAVDGGILAESSDILGLEYRARGSLYNQSIALTLNAADGPGDIVNPFSPVEDDAALLNDFTASRTNGSSFRVVDQAHIDEHGRYDDGVTVNIHTDAELPNVAGWRLHLGTWPGMRYPSVALAINAKPAIADTWIGLVLGDRVVVTGLPSQHPTDVGLLLQGYTETLSPQFWDVAANTTPAGPWTIGVLDDDDLGRADTDGSQLVVRATADDTVLLVGRTGDVDEDFEDADLDITVTGTWARSQVTPQAGAWCLASADIADGEHTDAFIAVPAGSTRLRFWYRVSSESGFDFMTVYVDGDQVLQDSGETGWTLSPEIDVAGKSLVSLRYAKDSSLSEGEDAAYIDTVTFLGPGVGPVWTTDPAEMPIDLTVGGETVTATAIGGPVADTYTRTVADGWGAATTGQTWASSGAATDYDVTGGQGLIALSTVGVARWCTVDLGHAGAVDIRGTVATDVLAAGGPHLPALVARYVDTSNSYLARLVINTDATIAVGLLKIVAGVETGLASVATGITHTAAGRVALRMTIDGTTLRAKAWAADTAEPAGWTVTATDGDLTTGTRVGIYGRLSSGCTNPLPVLMSCEDVVVSDGRSPQRFVVTRSVNTVIKTHAAGTDIRLAQPAILAW